MESNALLVKNKAISLERRKNLLSEGYRLVGNVWFNPQHWEYVDNMENKSAPFAEKFSFEGEKFLSLTEEASEFIRSHNKRNREMDKLDPFSSQMKKEIRFPDWMKGTAFKGFGQI